MSEGNGSDNLRQRVEALEKAHQELEDSVIVLAHLENKMSRMLKEQAEYMAAYEARLREQEKRDQIIDGRIDKLVSGIGELVRRLP